MKGGIVSLLGLVILLFWSCVKEDLDDCPDPVPVPTDNLLVLQFEYFDVKGKDVFDDRIDTIDVAVFDASHMLVYMDSYAVKNLTHRSVSYELDPGTYYVVCWSNNRSARDEIPTPSYTEEIHIGDILLKHKKNRWDRSAPLRSGLPGRIALYRPDLCGRRIRRL